MPLLPAWLAGPRARAPAAPPADEAKSSPTRRLIALTGAGRPSWTPLDYAALAREGYAGNPVVHRCVRLIAEAAASLPLVVHAADGARAGPEHPLQRLLDRPNPEESGPDLMERFFGALETSGNGYLECAGDPDAPDRRTVRAGLHLDVHAGRVLDHLRGVRPADPALHQALRDAAPPGGPPPRLRARRPARGGPAPLPPDPRRAGEDVPPRAPVDGSCRFRAQPHLL